MKMRAAAVAVLLSAVATAGAAEVYRCGSTYGQRPCAEGRRVEIADDRTSEQQAAALRIAAAEQRRIMALERERRERERALRPAGAARLDRDSVKPPTVLPAQKHRKKPRTRSSAPDGDFVASDPSTRKKRGAG